MGIGTPALQTSQKTEQAGPPFVPTSARNGLSVDASGAIVLGNNAGGSVAQLLSNREIPLNGFSLKAMSAGRSKLLLDPANLRYGIGDIAQSFGGGLLIDDTVGASLVSLYSFTAGAGPQIQLRNQTAEIPFLFGATIAGRFNLSGLALGSADSTLFPLKIGSTTNSIVISNFALANAPTNPGGMINVIVSSAAPIILGQRTSADGSAPIITLRKSRGSDPTVPATLVGGDICGTLRVMGVDAGVTPAYRTGAEQRVVAGTPLAAAVPMAWGWFTTNVAGTFAQRMVLTTEGFLGLQFPAGAPSDQLELLTGNAKTLGTAGNTFKVVNAAAAPTPVAAVPVFVDYYGTGGTRALSEPDNWLLWDFNGALRKIPAYAV